MGDDDKRRTRRQRVLKEGRIITLANQSIVNCVVRDLSDTGARLKCGDQVAVPTEFRLQVGHERTVRPARAVWRRGNEIGIVFTGDPVPAPGTKH
jgi:two-component system cell cycle response regulator